MEGQKLGWGRRVAVLKRIEMGQKHKDRRKKRQTAMEGRFTLWEHVANIRLEEPIYLQLVC